jgi:hypothetical protein
MGGCAKGVQTSFWPDEEIRDMAKIAKECLGAIGRRLGGMKATTIFNACIFNSRGEKVWFGDIDIDRDNATLLELSARLGPLYIFDSPAGRFMKRVVLPGGQRSKAAVLIEEGRILCSRAFAERAGIVRGKTAVWWR